MKQILQNLKNGETSIEVVPAPLVKQGSLSIRTRASLLSAGTERMLVEFGKGNLIQKARSQPDKVKQVLEKVKTDGLFTTLDAVRAKLDAPLPLGYCNVGVVDEVGKGVDAFQVGDRVLSNGKHAELVVVPKNLCAKVPDNVDDESASFTVIGAIALQGIRLIAPTLGETIVVTGLGLIGLMAVQLLKANGCRVIGLDFDASKLELAKSFGAEVVDLSSGASPVDAVSQITSGLGVDGVLLTASTKSNEPISQAAHMCRKRGRIVLVGVVGMELSRADFYEKELSFQVSCSYGPGRYDENYEEYGQDYPLPYVRWTEQRNFEAVLQIMSEGRVNVKPLITHRFDIDDAQQAYELISNASPLGVVLNYPSWNEPALVERTISLVEGASAATQSTAKLGFIGAGNYASSVLVPAFAKTGAELSCIASSTGVSSKHLAKKFGFKQATSDAESLFCNDAVNSLVIATRHNTHAELVLKALENNKHVFVEKPLALHREEVNAICNKMHELGNDAPLLMVGFNRRYSPFIQKAKALLEAQAGPASFVMTVNAGKIDSSHWTQNREVGGGRIIGEACHFIDLLRFLAGDKIKSVHAVAMDSDNKDSVSINLQFTNGCIGSIHYLANGSKAFPKERLEVFKAGGILQLDNFKSMRGFAWPGFSKMKTRRQDKGQTNCSAAFVTAIEEGNTKGIIPIDELAEVAEACFTVVEQIGA